MFKQHPKGLVTLFFAEIWERFSFYGMRSLLTLYMTLQLFNHLQDPENRAKAYGIYAAYGALVYATPLLGGFLADKLLGNQKAVLLGGTLMAIGHFVLAIETELMLYIGLSFIIIGSGFFKPNISSMVGGLYGENDSRRDGGFTIFYMAINIGAFLSPIACGFIGETYGWFYGFGLAGFGMILGLFVFGKGRMILGENGLPPNPDILKKKILGMITVEYSIYFLSIIGALLISLLLINYEIMSFVILPFALTMLLMLFVISLKSTKVERQRLWVILVLLFFTTLFWAFFEQAGSSLTLFTQENVDREFFGYIIPASVFQSVNPLFIIFFGPLFAALWIKLGKIGKEPSTPIKFALGIIQLGIGYLVLKLGISFLGVDESAVLMPMIFLILAYMFHTTGELCVSPVGLSMVTKLAPKRIVAMTMGAWFLANAMAHHIAGFIAKLTSFSYENSVAGEFAVKNNLIESVELQVYSTEVLTSFDKLAGYLSVFENLGWIALAAGFLLIAISPILRKWMHGIH